MSSPLPQCLVAARQAQARWRATPLRHRLGIIGRLRSLIARDGLLLAEAAAAPRQRPRSESLTAEVIPLAAACAFLQREAPVLLQPRKIGRKGRPLWLSGVSSVIYREPFGVVLVVGPANYPLFLPGVQAVQALTAGNAVLLKPGRASTPAAAAFASLCAEAGLPPNLLHLLPERVEEVHDSLAAGVDLVVFTGSTQAGREVLYAAAAHLIPVIAELSGEDAFIVREDADPELAVRALRFGRELNGGNSCIAPRRLAAVGSAATTLREHGAADEFTGVPNDAAAITHAAASAFALGATIISRDFPAAERLACQIPAGVVVINDCLMPTADPRLPFGGRGASGFGVTRGAEGLLALTRPKVIVRQRGARRHLAPAQSGDEQLFLAYLRAAHSQGWRARLSALRDLWRRAAARLKTSS